MLRLLITTIIHRGLRLILLLRIHHILLIRRLLITTIHRSTRICIIRSTYESIRISLLLEIRIRIRITQTITEDIIIPSKGIITIFRIQIISSIGSYFLEVSGSNIPKSHQVRNITGEHIEILNICRSIPEIRFDSFKQITEVIQDCFNDTRIFIIIDHMELFTTNLATLHTITHIF